MFPQGKIGQFGELPDFIKEMMKPEALAKLGPSEILKVTLDLKPDVPGVGRGEPIKVGGQVMAFGLPVPIPMPVVLQIVRKPETFPKPIAWSLTMPFLGSFALEVPTKDWEYGQYAFQVIVLAPGALGLSGPKVMRVEEVRLGGALEAAGLVGAASPLILYAHLLPSSVVAAFAIRNSGNVTENYQTTLASSGATSPTPRDDLSVAPGVRVPATGTVSLTLGWPATLTITQFAILALLSHPTSGLRPGQMYAQAAETVEVQVITGGLEAVAWAKVD